MSVQDEFVKVMSHIKLKEKNMTKQETITLNGKTYIEVDPNAKVIKPAIKLITLL